MIVARIIMTSVNTNMFKQTQGALVELSGIITINTTMTVDPMVTVL